MTSPIEVEDNSAHLTVIVNKILHILYDECEPAEALDVISNITAAILAASKPSPIDRINALISVNEAICTILKNSDYYHTDVSPTRN
jgi:hypothetical protein